MPVCRALPPRLKEGRGEQNVGIEEDDQRHANEKGKGVVVLNIFVKEFNLIVLYIKNINFVVIYVHTYIRCKCE